MYSVIWHHRLKIIVGRDQPKIKVPQLPGVKKCAVNILSQKVIDFSKNWSEVMNTFQQPLLALQNSVHSATSEYYLIRFLFF